MNTGTEEEDLLHSIGKSGNSAEKDSEKIGVDRWWLTVSLIKKTGRIREWTL